MTNKGSFFKEVLENVVVPQTTRVTLKFQCSSCDEVYSSIHEVKMHYGQMHCALGKHSFGEELNVIKFDSYERMKMWAASVAPYNAISGSVPGWFAISYDTISVGEWLETRVILNKVENVINEKLAAIESLYSDVDKLKQLLEDEKAKDSV